MIIYHSIHSCCRIILALSWGDYDELALRSLGAVTPQHQLSLLFPGHCYNQLVDKFIISHFKMLQIGRFHRGYIDYVTGRFVKILEFR